MARTFSGIQPTGEKHLGNYLGAIRGWVADQEQHECLFCLVDLHALTAAPEPEALRRDTRRLAALLLASGLDPERCTLFVQSQVPAHTELAWLLACITGVGELRRMTQFKAKAEAAASASAALLTYPVLQAADVLLYRAERVPVEKTSASTSSSPATWRCASTIATETSSRGRRPRSPSGAPA